MCSAVDYVRALEIDISQIKLSVGSNIGVTKKGSKKGFVCGGSLASFVSTVSDQATSDVQNSTLLAQMVADKQFNRSD